MKSTLRFLLGVLSSLFFAAGLRAAADRLDPLSQSLPSSSSTRTVAGATDSTFPCHFDDASR